MYCINCTCLNHIPLLFFIIDLFDKSKSMFTNTIFVS